MLDSLSPQMRAALSFNPCRCGCGLEVPYLRNYVSQLSLEFRRSSEFGKRLCQILNRVEHQDLPALERDQAVSNLAAWSLNFEQFSNLAHDWSVGRITKEQFEASLPSPPTADSLAIAPDTLQLTEEEGLFLSVALNNCYWCIVEGLMSIADVEAEVSQWSIRQRLRINPAFEKLKATLG